MCKYCKRLEEVRKNECDNLIKCIRSHQRYERKLFKLFVDLYTASLDFLDLKNDEAVEEFCKAVNNSSEFFESEE